ncbi:LPXTG cell wall anchor domain-containing protein [Schumannella luteola]
MKTARILAALGVAAALTFAAAPAHAAAPALPAGEGLLAASCTDAYPAAEIFRVDPATGVSSAIGTGDADFLCNYQGAWDATTSTYYGTIWDNAASELVTWDLTTGEATKIGDILDGDEPLHPYSLVISLGGAAYFNVDDDLYSLDLTTGAATFLGQLDGITDEAYGFSVDPSTGDLYLLQEDGELFLIDPIAVTATYVATWAFSTEGTNTWGLAIDSAGTAWVVEYPGDENYTALWSTPLATFGVDPLLSGNIVDAATGEDFTGWWVALVPAAAQPALAATGFDATPIAAAGGMLALAGLALVASRRRRVA